MQTVKIYGFGDQTKGQIFYGHLNPNRKLFSGSIPVILDNGSQIEINSITGRSAHNLRFTRNYFVLKEELPLLKGL